MTLKEKCHLYFILCHNVRFFQIYPEKLNSLNYHKNCGNDDDDDDDNR